ncbi:MAG: uroporphyrinogen decarboxylase family protein [Planctomycetota bacterium]
MTGRERILAAFRGEPSDRAPCFEQSISSGFASRLLGREAHVGLGELHRAEVESWLAGGEEAHEEFVAGVYRDLVDLVRELGLDGIRPPWRFSRRPSRKLDEFNYEFGEPGGPGHLVMRYSPGSATLSEVAEETDPGDMDVLERDLQRRREAWDRVKDSPPEESAFKWIRRLREQCPDLALATTHGFISIPPQENWLMATALRPDLVEAHLDMCVEQFLRDLPALREIGVDFLHAGGDMASNAGPMYSPQVFHDLLLPRLQRITSAAHGAGLYYVFRSDGVLWPVGEDLFAASGVDGYGEIDIGAGVDLLDARERYPQLTLFGGIECGELLTNGTPEAVRAEARRVVEGLRPGGRHVLGSSNSVSFKVPVENYRAMLEAAREPD